MPALRNDAEVRQEAIEALTRDVRVDASHVDLQVVNGIVTLRGSVATPFERRVAADLVRRVKGVRELRNELRVPPTPSRSDAEIAADARAALSRQPGLDMNRVVVQLHKGVVTLSGIVGSYAARAAADEAVWQVSGVVDLLDQLAIVPEASRTDSEIAGEVRIDLAHNLDLTRQKIQVEVKGGIVYLTGTVTSQELKWLADEVAWWTAGVRDVVNQLVVEPSTSFPPNG